MGSKTSYQITVTKNLVEVRLDVGIWTWIYNLVSGCEDFDKDTNTLTVKNDPIEGSADIVKSVTSKPADGSDAYVKGEKVKYLVKVTNTGTIDLKGVKVTDELTGDTWTIDILKAGETKEFTPKQYEIADKDIQNKTVLNEAVLTYNKYGKNPEDPADPGYPADIVTKKSDVKVNTKSTSPQTGDFSHTGMWLTLMLAAVIIIISGTVMLRKRKVSISKLKYA